MGVASFDKLKNPETNGCTYGTVEVWGETVGIGTLRSSDMLAWVTLRDGETDKAKRREAMFVLIVKSLVDDDKNRIPEEEQATWVEIVRNKDSAQNDLLLDAILKLNKWDTAGPKALKNASSAAPTTDSPTDSPSQ